MEHAFCVYEESLEEECICKSGWTGRNCSEVTEVLVEPKYLFNLSSSCKEFNVFVHEHQGTNLTQLGTWYKVTHKFPSFQPSIRGRDCISTPCIRCGAERLAMNPLNTWGLRKPPHQSQLLPKPRRSTRKPPLRVPSLPIKHPQQKEPPPQQNHYPHCHSRLQLQRIKALHS